MRKRVITAAVGVVGLVVIGLGVASATVWRADDVLVATATATTPVVVTDPGVLELGGDPATVRVTVPDGDVVAVVGRDTDVDGWVGADPYTRVTGLSGWDALATTAGEPVTAPGGTAPDPATPDPAATGDAAAPPADATAAATEAPAADASAGAEPPADAPTQVSPAGNDNWVAEAAGTGSVELVWPAQNGRWSLLAVSTGGSEPTIEISWPRVVTTPWLWPCVVVGSLLVLAAAFVLLRGRMGHREDEWEPVHTGSVPALADTGRPLTRRELREAAQAARGRTPTGSLPRVTGPQQVVAPHDEGRHASPAAPRTGSSSDTLPSLPATVPGLSDPADAPAAPGTPSAAPAPVGAGTPLSRRAMRHGGTPPTATVPAVPSGSPTTAARPPVSSVAGAPASSPSTPDASSRTTAPSAWGAAPGAAPSGLEPTGSARPGAGAPVPSTSGPAAASGPYRGPAGPSATADAPSRTVSTGPASPSGAPTGPAPLGGAPGAAGPASAPAAPAAGSTGGRSAWSRGPATPAPSSATPSSATPPRPGGVSGGPGAPAGGPDAPAGGAPDHHGRTRPSWLSSASSTAAAGHSAAPTPTPAAPAGASSLPTPGGWIPTGPGPDGTPTGQAPATGGEQRPGDTAGSRADAWRRAWGLPAAAEPDPGTQTPEQGSGEGDR